MMMNMTEEYNRLIGKRVKMQRISAKVSQTELAKELGVTQTHLSNIENGRAGLTIPNLIKLHQILECPISSFFVDIEGEKEADNSSDITGSIISVGVLTWIKSILPTLIF